MTIQDALAMAGINQIDAEVLLSAVLGTDRTHLLAHPEVTLTANQQEKWKAYIHRRMQHEPVALILGIKEFYGRMFTVTRDTLVPRPATELLVQTALQMIDGKEIPITQKADAEIVIWSEWKNGPTPIQLVIDVGTGSGCVGITLALEQPSLHLIATDMSKGALSVAEKNAHAHNVSDRIQFMETSGFNFFPAITEPFLLVSNPPYIPEDAQLEPDVCMFEPSSALFAGKEGTDVLYPLIQQAMKHPLCVGFCVECREEQIDIEI